MGEPPFSPKKLAERWGCSRQYVHKLIKAGELQHFKLGSKLVRVSAEESTVKLRRYAVTVMDNWTPMRVFWTLRGATTFAAGHPGYAHIFRWSGGAWQRVTRAPGATIHVAN